MEKINIQIYEDYVLEYINVYMEKSHDYISKGNYSFEPGKIYGIICEQGSGGEGIAQILTNPQGCKAKAYFDDDKKMYLIIPGMLENQLNSEARLIEN